MLSQCWYWKDKGTHDKDGWFHKTQKEWEAETFMGRSEQETARKILRSKGFLEEKRRGNPCRLWFCINRQKILQAIESLDLSQYARIQQSSVLKSGKQDCDNPANKHAGKSHALIQRIPSETTTESTNKERAKDMSNLRNSTEARTRKDLKLERAEKKRRAIESVQGVFEYWKAVANRPADKFGPDRQRIALKTVALGYNIEQMKYAIEGNGDSEWHQGQNDFGKVFNEFTSIFKNTSTIDKFLGDRRLKLAEDGYNHCGHDIPDISSGMCEACGAVINCAPIHDAWVAQLRQKRKQKEDLDRYMRESRKAGAA